MSPLGPYATVRPLDTSMNCVALAARPSGPVVAKLAIGSTAPSENRTRTAGAHAYSAGSRRAPMTQSPEDEKPAGLIRSKGEYDRVGLAEGPAAGRPGETSTSARVAHSSRNERPTSSQRSGLPAIANRSPAPNQVSP